MMLTIRPLATDVEQVLALWQANCVEVVGHPLDVTSTVRVRANLQHYVNHAQYHGWVALHDEKAWWLDL
jgi:hypothetical protein